MNKYGELILSVRSTPVAVLVDDGRLHRGYRDASGVFTLEADNIDDTSAQVFAPAELPDPETSYELCQRCFRS